MATLPGVRVTGTVPDVRPYLAHAHLAVAPLRIARGVQNKVLEAMAMAQPVLATQAAMEGIVPCPDLQENIADDPALLAQRALALLADPNQREQHGRAGRGWVLRHYHWDRNLSRISSLLEEDAA